MLVGEAGGCQGGAGNPGQQLPDPPEQQLPDTPPANRSRVQGGPTPQPPGSSHAALTGGARRLRGGGSRLQPASTGQGHGSRAGGGPRRVPQGPPQPPGSRPRLCSPRGSAMLRGEEPGSFSRGFYSRRGPGGAGHGSGALAPTGAAAGIWGSRCHPLPSSRRAGTGRSILRPACTPTAWTCPGPTPGPQPPQPPDPAQPQGWGAAAPGAGARGPHEPHSPPWGHSTQGGHMGDSTRGALLQCQELSG